MDLSVVKRRQLNDYIADGSVMGLQKFFADATDGFINLVKIANGHAGADGTIPPYRDQIAAMKLIMDKAFPSLQASHVINQTVEKPATEDVDVSGLLRELSQLTDQAKEMKKREVG